MTGLDRFEHDAAANPPLGKIIWNDIPVGPESVVARYILRIPRFSWLRPASWWPWLRWRISEWRLDHDA